MLNGRTVFGAFGIGGIVLVFAPNHTPLTAPERTVSGRVFQVGTPTPVQGVAAYFSGINVGMVTGRRGEYVLDNVPVGAKELTFTHPCYFAVKVSIPPTGDVSVSIGMPFDQSTLNRPGCGGLGARVPDSGQVGALH